MTPSGDGSITLPPGGGRVAFEFAAMHLANPDKVSYRYRLGGLEKEWIDAGNERHALYHRLLPGDYDFQVIADNGYGKWSKTASLAVLAQPYWWERSAVKVLAALLVLLLVWLVISWRIRALHERARLKEKFSRGLLQAQEAERKRIARDLHDSLGQNLLAAKNQLFLVQQLDPEGEAQAKLERVNDSVAAALEEARAISHKLRPVQLERLGLTKSICSLVKQTTESTNIPIEADIDSVDGLFPSESEITMYRILQEALTNVVKHADASLIKLEVKRREGWVKLLVEDDGRGFDAEKMAAQDGEHGLGWSGFQERASLLGGKFNHRSSPGKGTRVSFEIPISSE